MNVASKLPIVWINSRYESAWRCYLHGGIQETGNNGIISISCHQVLRHPSAHASSSMRKHSHPKAHITKYNELTESEVSELTSSTVNERALVTLKR